MIENTQEKERLRLVKDKKWSSDSETRWGIMEQLHLFFFFFSAELKRRGFGGMSGKKKLALRDTG